MPGGPRSSARRSGSPGSRSTTRPGSAPATTTRTGTWWPSGWGACPTCRPGCGGTASRAAAVVRSRVFRQLTALSCRTDRPGGGGRGLVDGLTQLTNPPRLASLDLSGNRLTAELVARLLSAPAIAAVEDLDLSDNNLGAA